jgi:serine/threonine-protein kinase
MLTGEPPHVGATSQAIIARVLTERPRSIRATRSSVPEHVEGAVDQALEKLPADRWPTARDFAEALTGARPVVRGGTIGVSSARVPRSAAEQRRELVAWSLVAALAIATSYFAIRASRPVDAPMSSEFEVTLPDSLELPATRSIASIALSRDGRTLVFVGQKGAEKPRLYSRRVGDRFVQEIRGTEDARSPVISPDGKEVLFALPNNPNVGPGATIKRVDVAGGVPRTLTESGSRNGQLSWREGNQVVMVALDQSLVVVDAANGHQQVVLKSKSPKTRLLTQYGFPDVLPGGKAALITIGETQTLDSVSIGTVTIPEGKVIDLGIHGMSPRYSATGHLVYGTPEGSVYAVPFNPRALLVTGPPVLLAEKVGGGRSGAVPFAVADNGTIAFVQGQLTRGQAQPVIVTRAGVKRLFGAASGFILNPRISPDGRQVVYAAGDGLVSLLQLDRPDVWRLDVATGKSLRVTTDGASDRPIWSRDGTEILFSKVPRDSTEYAIGLSAGAQPRVLFHGPGPLGSSDVGPQHGYAIIGVGGAGTGVASPSADLWMAPMDSLDKARPFATEPYSEGLPRISPDGRVVAYGSYRTGHGEIYIRSIVGSSEEILVSSGGGSDPAWSRDGHELFFRSPRQLMMAARIATSPKPSVVSVSALFPLDGFFTSPARTVYDVFPNGDFLMLATRVDTGKVRTPLVVRLNWPSALGERSERR